MKRVLLSILVAGALLLSACGAPAEAPPTPQSQSQVVGEWAGIGPKTTAPFTIESESWVIDWAHVPSVINDQPIGTLQIIVHDAEDPDAPITIAANSMEEESSTSYIDGAGTFYLMINAANTRWSVKVLVTQEE